ncbi:nuclear transport factor 2 family protein [Lutimonas zeaxanthinifaciens]|uniref:nuclear transport factor 2 family protein n=1 Tax=Lutimonas zeaxanthinifaciens TaxID=3060215 RepID=UPI00265D35DE|nr:nuclear transport factor 2 family protein [Lutimonas sp. YSD2104]WKK65906.1 nuclear transport factor 2 family protein [Lutimonas sp. YSD2104]
MKKLKANQYTHEYVADRLQIQDLCTRYAVGVDRKEWKILRSCFTDDAMIDYTAMGGYRNNLDGTVEFLKQAMALFVGYQHLMVNHEIDIDGDKATGRVGFYNPMPIKTEDGMVFFLCGGWYIDEYVRTSDGWKISSRSQEFSFDTSKIPFVQNYPEPGQPLESNESPESIERRMTVKEKIYK